MKKKIETNLNQQIIPKLCDGQYELQPSTLGYTLFDAKIVPWNGKDGWLRFITVYAGIIKYDSVEESNFREGLIAEVSHLNTTQAHRPPEMVSAIMDIILMNLTLTM